MPSNDDSTQETEDSLSSREVALYGAMIIGQARVYDVLLMMYMKMDEQGAIDLRKMHEEGRMWFPPPAFTEED